MKFACGVGKVSSIFAVLVSMAVCAAPATVNAQYSHTWSRLIGGTGNSQVYGTAIDPVDGAVYVVGSFKDEVKFDALTFISTFNTNRTNDMFLAKFDENGAVLWAKQYGGIGQDRGLDVTVDSAGHVYAIGTIGLDMAVRRVDPTTGDDVWSQTFGGMATDVAFTLESNGSHAIVTAGTRGTIAFGAGYTFTSASGRLDIVMAALNASDGSVSWARHFPGSGDDSVRASALDEATNRIVLTGYASAGIDLGTGVLPNSSFDIFVAAYSLDDGATIWAQTFGGSAIDSGEGVAIDAAGNLYLAGYHALGSSGTGADFGDGPLTTFGSGDVFLAKLTRDGEVVWAQSHGGFSFDYARDIAVGSDGNIAVIGDFQASASFGGETFASSLFRDVWLAGYTADGQHLWSSTHGTTLGAFGFAIAAGKDGEYVAGGLAASQVDFGGGVLTGDGGGDGFLAKFRSTLPPTTSLSGQVSHAESGVGVPGVKVLVTSNGTTRSAVTDANGIYLVTGIPEQGDWTIELSKDGGISHAISSYDASFILRHATGGITLTPDQLLAADVTGNGTVSSYDAAKVLQYVTGRISHFSEAVTCESDWLFVHEAAEDFSVTSAGSADGHCAENLINGVASGTHPQLDYRAVGLGDVTGNWSP